MAAGDIGTNTYLRFAQIGIKEDLANVIYNIAPEDTPFLNNAGRGKANNTLVEWQEDTLAAAVTSNYQLDGSDAMDATAAVATVRMNSQCQIARKVPLVSGRAIAANAAGRGDELSYQVAKLGAELKRDMEYHAIGGTSITVTGNSTTPSQTASFRNWIKTNDVIGAGAGASPTVGATPTVARTNGDQTAFSEAKLKACQVLCFNAGAKPTILMCGPVNKQRTSGFAGIAALTTFTTGAKAATIIGAASVYVGDFGTLTVVPNRFQLERDVFLIDPDYIDILYYRPFQTIALAKTGDAEKRMLLADYCLKVGTEKAHGMIADNSTT